MNFTPIVPIEKMELFGSSGQVTGGASANVPFQNILQEAFQNLDEAKKATEQDSYDLAMGNTDNLGALMINSSKQTAAIQMTTQLASRAVSAYREIMQMQV